MSIRLLLVTAIALTALACAAATQQRSEPPHAGLTSMAHRLDGAGKERRSQ